MQAQASYHDEIDHKAVESHLIEEIGGDQGGFTIVFDASGQRDILKEVCAIVNDKGAVNEVALLDLRGEDDEPVILDLCGEGPLPYNGPVLELGMDLDGDEVASMLFSVILAKHVRMGEMWPHAKGLKPLIRAAESTAFAVRKAEGKDVKIADIADFLSLSTVEKMLGMSLDGIRLFKNTPHEALDYLNTIGKGFDFRSVLKESLMNIRGTHEKAEADIKDALNSIYGGNPDCHSVTIDELVKSEGVLVVLLPTGSPGDGLDNFVKNLIEKSLAWGVEEKLWGQKNDGLKVFCRYMEGYRFLSVGMLGDIQKWGGRVVSVNRTGVPL